MLAPGETGPVKNGRQSHCGHTKDVRRKHGRHKQSEVRGSAERVEREHDALDKGASRKQVRTVPRPTGDTGQRATSRRTGSNRGDPRDESTRETGQGSEQGGWETATVRATTAYAVTTQ